MGKRSNFERNPRDYYPTPKEAVLPLIEHLGVKTFIEPCAGDYRLVEHLEDEGLKCVDAFDLEPQDPRVRELNAFNYNPTVINYDAIITNPPWERKTLHPLILHYSNIAPTWFLFDADWMHTKQSSVFMEYCKTIVSVGRVKWFGNMSGKDNCCWYEFTNELTTTTMIGR